MYLNKILKFHTLKNITIIRRKHKKIHFINSSKKIKGSFHDFDFFKIKKQLLFFVW